MQENKQRVNNLLESLPYIEQFRGKTFVFKYGGSLIDNIELKKKFVEDISLLIHLNIKVIIIHGGGKNISKRLEEKGIEAKFHEGYRITNDEAIEEVEMVLSGNINKDLVLNFVNRNINAIGLNGKDAGLVKASKKIIDEHVDIGNVGEVENINKEFIELLIENRYLPIISPIGYDDNGKTYNINADDVASEVANAVQAEKLFFLSDVEGLYLDFEDKSSFINKIHVDEASDLIEKKIITGGMIPKLKSCINAVKNGVNAVHIIDGRVEHSVLLEVFTNSGIGTMIEE